MARLIEMPDGLHEDVVAGVYHERVPGLVSRTALVKFQYAPAVYKAWLDGENAEDDEAEPLAFGSAFHCALLEPLLYARDYTVEPAFGDCRAVQGRTTKEDAKENKTRRDAWRVENAGKRFLEADDARHIDGMCRAVRSHERAGKLITGGVPEVTALWTDEATGLRCKARADYWHPDRRLVVDVKSTRDARPGAFARDVARYGYDEQQGFYGDGFAACGAPIDNFVFLCVDKKPPYLVGLYMLDIESIANGRAAVRESVNAMAECVRAGFFPGLDSHIKTIHVRRYAA